jgi:hypothetical protein
MHRDIFLQDSAEYRVPKTESKLRKFVRYVLDIQPLSQTDLIVQPRIDKAQLP